MTTETELRPMQKTEEIVDWNPKMMLEINLETPDDFLKVKETLTRIGVASRREKTLIQSCHVLHKQGRYFIVHFKELFLLDGKPSNLTKQDVQRRNTIATLISDWGLAEIVSPSDFTDRCPVRLIKVLPFKEKANWNLTSKYSIGNRHR